VNRPAGKRPWGRDPVGLHTLPGGCSVVLSSKTTVAVTFTLSGLVLPNLPGTLLPEWLRLRRINANFFRMVGNCLRVSAGIRRMGRSVFLAARLEHGGIEHAKFAGEFRTIP